MRNKTKHTGVEWYHQQIVDRQNGNGDSRSLDEIFDQAKEMQQEQAQLYAMFVLMSVHNNLPPITFNDWVGNIRR
jgi:hypothetical protein